MIMSDSRSKHVRRLLSGVVVLLLAATQVFAADKRTIEEEGSIPDWRARWELARTLSYAQKLDESIAQYQKLLKERPDLAQAKAEMATVMFWKGKQKEAMKILEQVSERDMTPEARLVRADILAARGEYAEAERLYREHLSTHANADAVRYKLAETLSWAKKYKESVKEYEVLLSSCPTDIQVRRKYALVLSWMGRHEEAAIELEKTLGKELLQ